MPGRSSRPIFARRRLISIVSTLVLLLAACGSDDSGEGSVDDADPTTTAEPRSLAGADASTGESAGNSAEERTQDTAETAPETAPAVELVSVAGTVRSTLDGQPLSDVSITTGDEAGDSAGNEAAASVVVTDESGRFSIEAPAGGSITVDRPAWEPTEVPVPADGEPVTVALEPFTARALRVSGEVAADPVRYEELLDLTEVSSVNTLVFDTKDETDRVLYRTEVAFAAEIGAVAPLYDPAELLPLARERGLYSITRIVTFEDPLWTETTPEAQLALAWVDPTDRANWDYPLDLAVEACELGFDEVQFDYVRFPAGLSAELARDAGRVPETVDERSAVISEFLGEARRRLAPMGCGVSAAIFGIVMSSPGDEGIGQTVEAVSASVDAVSPMLYPSHYGPGWIGFDDPNDHPGPVIAHALDGGGPRVAANTLMRPWLQAFYYNGTQIRAQIDEVEQRGGGWILWNASGRYNPDWLPPAE